MLTYVGAQVDKLSPRVERLLSAAANQSSGAGQLQVDLESASLQQPGQAKAAEQVRVDQESAQLQQAGMQGVVKENESGRPSRAAPAAAARGARTAGTGQSGQGGRAASDSGAGWRGAGWNRERCAVIRTSQ